jgi:hypothetical protein
MTNIPDPGGPFVPPPPPPPPPSFGGGASLPPGDVGTLRVFFLVSLIVNAVATLVWLLSVLGFGAATCGFGCVLIVIPLVSGVAIVLDAMALSKMNLPPNAAIHGFLKTAAILDIVSGVVGMSVVPLVMGILCLVYLQKPEVQRYYGASA